MHVLTDYSSPNFGPRLLPLDMIVLHYTGMQSGQAALERLCDPMEGVSAHYLIDEDGRLYELVSPLYRAWHAGVSSWQGERDTNSRSIGIELTNPGHEWGYRDFPAPQIETLIKLLRMLIHRYGLSTGSIWGHSDVAPDRKDDPGEKFPWEALHRQGLGLWPTQATPLLRRGCPLAAIGYGDCSLKAARVAFKRHFRRSALHFGWTASDERWARKVAWLAQAKRYSCGGRSSSNP